MPESIDPTGGVLATRLSRVLDRVMDLGRVEVAELAEAVGVSQVTIRKDLDRLAQRGLLRREHGYAVAVSTDDIAGRLAYHHGLKRRIAEVAASSVADGETVLIESGSVCALLADALVRADRGITVVTNSLFIADYVREVPGALVTLLGGALQARSQVTVGPMVAEAASRFYVDKLFVGVDGYVPGLGFMAKDVMRAEAVRAMARQAAKLVVVSESQKPSNPGAVRLVEAGQVARMVTDERLAPEVRAELVTAGVDVVTVPVAGALTA